MNRYQVSRWSAPLTFALIGFARLIHVEGTGRIAVIVIAVAIFVAGVAADLLDLGALLNGRRGVTDDTEPTFASRPHAAPWWRRELGYQQRPASLAVIGSGVLSYLAAQSTSTVAAVLWALVFTLFGYGLWVFLRAPRR